MLLLSLYGSAKHARNSTRGSQLEHLQQPVHNLTALLRSALCLAAVHVLDQIWWKGCSEFLDLAAIDGAGQAEGGIE